MQLVTSAEESRPRRRPWTCLLAATVPLHALVAMLLLLPCSLFAQTSSANAHRFLLVVETSRSMQRRAQGVSKTVKEFLDSSFHGQLHDGDSLTLWTYSDNLISNQFLPWTAQTKIGLALRVADFLQPATYEKKANLDKVFPEIMRVLGESDLITVLLICSGDDKIQGTSVDQQLNDGCQQWQSEVLQARMPMVILLRASHGQLTDWSVSPATWPIELPPLPAAQATVSTTPRVPAVAATHSTTPQTNPAPAIAQTGPTVSQTTAPSPSTKPVSVQPPSTESNFAPVVLRTGSDQAPRQPEATAPPVAIATPQVPAPQTTNASPLPAATNPAPSATPQVQSVQTASATPASQPASGAASQTPPTPPPVEVPKSKDTNLPSPVPSLPAPALAQAVPPPSSPAQQQAVTDALPPTATTSVVASAPKASAPDSQPPPSLPLPAKPAAVASSSPPAHSTVVETSLWMALAVVSVVGAIYFIWSWLPTYLRPDPPQRIILQPRSTTAKQNQQPAPFFPHNATPTTPQIIDRKHPAPTATPSPQKKETV